MSLCVCMYINEASWHNIFVRIVVGRSGPKGPGPNFCPSPPLALVREFSELNRA